jgi:hypothetical protein
MPFKSEVVDDIQAVGLQAEILKLALMGMQPTAIAERVGCSVRTVTTELDDGLVAIRELLLERAERLAAISAARLELLIQAGMPYAVGGVSDTGIVTVPDRDWSKVVAGHIKLEFDMFKELLAIKAKSPDDGDTLITTITSHDTHYEIAQINMEADWLGDYADMTAADLIPAEISGASETALPLDKKIQKAQKQVDELLKVVGTEETPDGTDSEAVH